MPFPPAIEQGTIASGAGLLYMPVQHAHLAHMLGRHTCFSGKCASHIVYLKMSLSRINVSLLSDTHRRNKGQELTREYNMQPQQVSGMFSDTP